MKARDAAVVEATEAASRPRPAHEFRIKTYGLFISHRYSRSAEYARLVAMLDRAAARLRSWRWKNLSVPADAPIMTADEANRAEVYNARIGDRLRSVHAILFIGKNEWFDNAGSLYNELMEAMPRYRFHIPVITVLPRGTALQRGRHPGPDPITVRWDADSIVAAVRAHAIPAAAGELQLSRAERSERAAIVAALRTSCGRMRDAARSLGMSRPALERKRMEYIIL